MRAVAPHPRGERRDVGPRVRPEKRKGGDRLTPRGAPDIAFLLRLGAGERDRAAAQSLHGESEVGEPRVESEYLAQQRERAHIETRVRGRAVGEEPGGAHVLYQAAADGILVRVVRVA